MIRRWVFGFRFSLHFRLTDIHHSIQDVPTTSRNSSYDRRSDYRHTSHPLGKALAITHQMSVATFLYAITESACLYCHSLGVVFPVSLTDSYIMGSFIECRVFPTDIFLWCCRLKVEQILSPPGSSQCTHLHHTPAFSLSLRAIELRHQVQPWNYLLTSGFHSRSFNPIHASSFTFRLYSLGIQTSLSLILSPAWLRNCSNDESGAYIVAGYNSSSCTNANERVVSSPDFQGFSCFGTFIFRHLLFSFRLACTNPVIWHNA